MRGRCENVLRVRPKSLRERVIQVHSASQTRLAHLNKTFTAASGGRWHSRRRGGYLMVAGFRSPCQTSWACASPGRYIAYFVLRIKGEA